jgi:hypothetical protein
MSKGKAKGFHEDGQGIIWFEKRVCVPQDPELRKLILQEAHDSPYSIHPGNTKMYKDLKGRFWWSNMKRDIANILPCVMYATELRQSIRNQQGYCSHCPYQSGSGIMLAWTLS